MLLLPSIYIVIINVIYDIFKILFFQCFTAQVLKVCRILVLQLFKDAVFEKLEKGKIFYR